jgi:hypothetical protein
MLCRFIYSSTNLVRVGVRLVKVKQINILLNCLFSFNLITKYLDCKQMLRRVL